TQDFDWCRTNALPELLAGAFDGHQPLYLDLRWARTEVQLTRKHPEFALSVARLSAAIRGRSLDQIFGDDVREQRRRLMFLALVFATLFLATAFAGWRWWGELRARHETSQVASQANLS